MVKKPHTSKKEPLPRWYRGADVPMRVIRRFARQVAERFHPDKIILFGSYAYGTPHADSDVDVPGFGDGELRLLLDPVDVSEERLVRVRRTYEPSRLIELAAIAIVGIGLHHAGGHEILDLAVRGSAADYLVDELRHHLEIAGRSRRSDLEVAWQQKWRRLQEAQQGGCYVCVAEFESPAGRLAFAG